MEKFKKTYLIYYSEQPQLTLLSHPKSNFLLHFEIIKCSCFLLSCIFHIFLIEKIKIDALVLFPIT